MTAPSVILVTQDGCNPCLRVKRLLAEISSDIGALNVVEVAFDSEEGIELAVRHKILFPPAVFVNGRLLAKGKVLEKELRGALNAPGVPAH